MAEGGFDEMEMEERQYPEYDDMSASDKKEKYDTLNQQRLDALSDGNTDQNVLDDYKSRLSYLDASIGETSFTEGHGDIEITDRGDKTIDVSKIPFVEPGVEVLPTLVEFVSKNYNGARLDPRCDAVMELRNNTSVTSVGNIEYKRRGRGGRLASQIVLKVDGNGNMQLNSDVKKSKDAIAEFKPLLERAIEETKSRAATRKEMPMVELIRQRSQIAGLSDEENRELDGVLNPSITIEPTSRLGDDDALQIQANHFQELINDVDVQVDRADKEGNVEEYIELKEREVGLREARDRTIQQRELEETVDAQEGDLTRFERLKKWLKENALSVSVIGISIAGIITSIIIAARKALVKGAQATSKFAKACGSFWETSIAYSRAFT